MACLSLFYDFALGDYDRMDGETVIGQPSYLKVQEQLRVFLDAPNLEYTDEPCPFPMDELLSDGSEDEHDVWRDVGGQSEDTHGYSHNSNDISVCRYNNHNHSCLSSGENSPNALATAASGALSHGGSSSHHGPSKDVRAALAKGNTFHTCHMHTHTHHVHTTYLCCCVSKRWYIPSISYTYPIHSITCS